MAFDLVKSVFKLCKSASVYLPVLISNFTWLKFSVFKCKLSKSENKFAPNFSSNELKESYGKGLPKHIVSLVVLILFNHYLI